MIKSEIRAFYLEYVNDYLTVDKLAADHGIDPETARQLIDWGRQYQNEHAEFMREIDQITEDFTAGD